MKKILLITTILAIFLISGVLATSTKVTGSTYLTWTHADNRPQLFSGTTIGDLQGTITLTTNTDYDIENTHIGTTHIGTTWSDDVILVLNDTTCTGFYAGSTINDGRNVGTFTLSCDNGNIIQGMMHGVNDATGNINLEYSGFLITPTPGQKGDQGIQGLPGINGNNGADGKDGINGINGIDGLPGAKGDKGDTGLTGLNGKDGINGLPGAKGDKGDQGIQGIQGAKGDTGSVGATGQCTCNLTAINNIDNGIFTYFPDFASWYNSIDKCTNGLLRCSGNNAQKCISNNWVTQSSCQYGCANGICNNPPITKEDCTNKNFAICSSGTLKIYYYGACTIGQGTTSSCNIGKCIPGIYPNQQQYCYYGCNSLGNGCK